MSVSYWVIRGIGLNTADIEPYINKKKMVHFLLDQFQNDMDLENIITTGDYTSFDIEEYCYEMGFDGLADILCYCDDTSTITCSNDGDGGAYFYYPPSMPWDHVPNEPQTEKEVIRRIIKAVQKITDMTKEEIKNVIDNDLYVVGFG